MSILALLHGQFVLVLIQFVYRPFNPNVIYCRFVHFGAALWHLAFCCVLLGLVWQPGVMQSSRIKIQGKHRRRYPNSAIGKMNSEFLIVT